MWSERGILDSNVVEDSLRVYGIPELAHALRAGDLAGKVEPRALLTRRAEQGAVILKWRWLADSSGIAFLEGPSRGCRKLFLFDWRSSSLQQLSREADCIGTFDIHNRDRFVYSAAVRRPATPLAPTQAAATVGTGKSLFELIFPDHDWIRDKPDAGLWWSNRERTLPIARNGIPIVRPQEDGAGNTDLILSPDGNVLLTAIGLSPASEESVRLYRAPYPGAPFGVGAGQTAVEYVRIDLRSGAVRSLTGAPTADAGGWFLNGDRTLARASWSADGKAIVLPGTYIASNRAQPSMPCVAVVNVGSMRTSCVLEFGGRSRAEPDLGYQRILDASFVNGDSKRVTVRVGYPNGREAHLRFTQSASGSWSEEPARADVGSKAAEPGVRIWVDEDLNRSPRLLVSDGRTPPQILWDPNPQLQPFTLVPAQEYGWKDARGTSWNGGLYLPRGYRAGVRYPLVIQTHGFERDRFLPAGWRPTAFAARALQDAGIMVLQVQENCALGHSDEAACAVAGYESAVDSLVAKGWVDPERVGLVGFSRTCYYVLESLTQSNLRIAAASITDGQMLTYFQYIAAEGLRDNGLAVGADALMGARPFADGLSIWLQRSPGFNLDKVDSPLLVVGLGEESLITMWEPYAALRYLGKPVDLMLLHTNEHVLTNPAVRLASQQGTVDWFRYWLKDERLPGEEKMTQYQRWQRMREIRQGHRQSAASEQAVGRQVQPAGSGFRVEPTLHKTFAPTRSLASGEVITLEVTGIREYERVRLHICGVKCNTARPVKTWERSDLSSGTVSIVVPEAGHYYLWVEDFSRVSGKYGNVIVPNNWLDDATRLRLEYSSGLKIAARLGGT